MSAATNGSTATNGRTEGSVVRTVIVSDEPLFRGGLKLLLEAVGHDPVFDLDDLTRAGRFCTGERPEWQVQRGKREQRERPDHKGQLD